MSHLPLALRTGLAFAISTSLATLAVAQCTNPWLAAPGVPGIEGSVSSMLAYDPDGPGPLGERVLVAGYFTAAGTTGATHLAIYDPALRTWAPFGPGPYPFNLRLARNSQGDLFVAGTFTSIAGVAATNVARWDGANWTPLGAGVSLTVGDLAAAPNGDIVVTGLFTSAGGVPTEGIARWNGSTWSSLGASVLGSVSQNTLRFGAITFLGNGDLAVATEINTSTPFTGVMRHDGTTWSPLGALGQTPGELFTAANGDVFAACNGGPSVVARWNGATWSYLPGAPFQNVFALSQLAAGPVVALGRPDFTSRGRVASWDGFAWTTLGDIGFGASVPSSLAPLANGELFAGGSFSSLAGTPVSSIARWNGVSWSATNAGMNGSGRWLVQRPDGGLFLGVAYGAPGQSLVHRWNGVSWMPIGGGYDISDGRNLTGLFAFADGSILAGGQVSAPQGPAAPILQQWSGSGSTWTTLATANFGTITAAVRLPTGQLVVGGTLSALDGVAVVNVARHDGTNWAPLGTGLPAAVRTLLVAPSGDLLALTSWGSVFRWNGTVWSQLGLAQSGAITMVLGADGSPVLAGAMNGADVLRWNGTTWAPLGSGAAGSVQSLAVLPDGDLVAGALVDTNGAPRPLERWDGSSWAPFGGTIDKTVHAMVMGIDGTLSLAGDFTVANGTVRGRFARIGTSCPASVTLQSGNCWYGGPTLTPDVLPWLGGSCRSTATNVPANALAIVASGLGTSSLLLSSVVPQASYGCTLLVAPDVLALALPTAGSVSLQVPVPGSASLLGLTFRQQLLSVVLGASGAVTDMRASNLLTFQVGSF